MLSLNVLILALCLSDSIQNTEIKFHFMSPPSQQLQPVSVLKLRLQEFRDGRQLPPKVVGGAIGGGLGGGIGGAIGGGVGYLVGGPIGGGVGGAIGGGVGGAIGGKIGGGNGAALGGGIGGAIGGGIGGFIAGPIGGGLGGLLGGGVGGGLGAYKFPDLYKTTHEEDVPRNHTLNSPVQMNLQSFRNRFLLTNFVSRLKQRAATSRENIQRILSRISNRI